MDQTLKLYLLTEGVDFGLPPTCTKTANVLCEWCRSAERSGVPGIPIQIVEKPDTADFAIFPYNLNDIYDHHALIGVNRFIQTIRNFPQLARKTVFFFRDDVPFDLEAPSVFFSRKCRSSVSQREYNCPAVSV